MSSWKLGTKKQYQTFTKRWFQYCSEEQVNSVRPALDNILEFLTSLFDKGLDDMILLTVRFEKPRFRYNFRTQDKLLELMLPETGVFFVLIWNF
jgi:hypothetical protein